MGKLGNILDEAFDGHMEVAARIAERARSFDDNVQRSAGCQTTGERIASAIRDAKRGNEHHKWQLENEPEVFEPPTSPLSPSREQ